MGLQSPSITLGHILRGRLNERNTKLQVISDIEAQYVSGGSNKPRRVWRIPDEGIAQFDDQWHAINVMLISGIKTLAELALASAGVVCIGQQVYEIAKNGDYILIDENGNACCF